MLNRHGLVAGATGTGKTKTLQLMAEQLSTAGVPVFAADIKGDLSGLASPGEPGEKITARAEGIGQEWQPTAYPVELLRAGRAGTGVPVRATVTSFGPTLLSKVLQLNDTQESSLGLVFHYADKAGLPLLDLKDLRAVIQHLTSDEGKADLEDLGGLSKPTAGVILRELITFADSGADDVLRRAGVRRRDLHAHDRRRPRRGHAARAAGVQDRPALFSTFLMWLLAELFEELPEVGDFDKPKLVFFFDEAHLLFKDASQAFPRRADPDRSADPVQGCRRLLRHPDAQGRPETCWPSSATGSSTRCGPSPPTTPRRSRPPSDVPDLAYDLEELLTPLGIGEAVVTVLSEKGAPTPVAWTRCCRRRSR